MKNYLLSCIYLTRGCPMHCEYCSIRKTTLERELSVPEWKRVFDIFKKLGCEFNLILGNETMMLEDGLVDIVKYLHEQNTHYALYSTCPSELFDKLKEPLAKAGLKNLSSGFDSLRRDDSIGIKSRRGFEGMLEMKKRIEGLDTQGTITLSKINLDEVVDLFRILTKNGIWGAVNSIHWDKDGKYDFFPPKEFLKDFIIDDREKFLALCGELKELAIKGEIMVQNPPEYFDALAKYGLDMSWHCTKPYIITVDADGQLRLCGYRRGTEVPKFSIFDLEDEKKFEEYKKVWKEESQKCPGCFWSYFWMAENFIFTDQKEYGTKVFQTHHSKYYNGK